MKRSRKKKIFMILLGILVIASFASSQDGGRLSIKCGAVEGEDRTNFLCSLIGSQGLDVFKQDQFGGVIELKPNDIIMSAINVFSETVGISGRGGARLKDGKVEVVDSVGRVTHRDFAPLDPKPLSSNAASIGIFGDAGKSPLILDLKSPIAGVNSGKVIFVGDAESIEVDISGRDGLDGRSARVAAALQILRGELGDSQEMRDLATKMGLTSILKDPVVNFEDLAATSDLCEQLPGGLYKTPIFVAGEGKVLATVDMAREMVVERALCERQTSQEFSIQTVCARPPEVSSTLRCEYPSLVRRSSIWKRPVENKKIAFSCTESVPEGQWNTQCVVEEAAVVGSALKTDYVSLKPSESIKQAMKKPLYHHFKSDLSPCNVDSPLSKIGLSDFSGFDQVSSPYREFFNTSTFMQKNYADFIMTNCEGQAVDKMDLLRLTGALVYKYDLNAFPGSDRERSLSDPIDITKLTYWSDRGSDKYVSGQETPTRSPLDNLNPAIEAGDQGPIVVDKVTADQPAKFYKLDPVEAPNAAETNRRSHFLDELVKAGFDRPNVSNAILSYDKIFVRKNFTHGKTLKDILCDMQEIPDGEDEICNALMNDFEGGIHTSARDLKFSEVITYEFDGLRSGIALRRAGTPFGDTESYLRAITTEDVSFDPRALYIPGDLEVTPITKTTYCKTIPIDNTEELIRSGEEYEFIGPEIEGGAMINLYGGINTASPYERNNSPTNNNHNAPTRTIGGWASSFMRVKTVDLDNSSCTPVTITHTVSDHEKKILDVFRNLNGVLLVAKDNQISAYYNPIKIPIGSSPKDNTLYVSQSLSPGLYMPKVSVSPMWLNAPSAHASDRWAGYGNPSRDYLGHFPNNSIDHWDNEIIGNVSLLAKTDERISYYALPSYFDPRYTRTLSGSNPTTNKGLVLISEGASKPGVPRYIKSLNELHLGVNSASPQNSKNTVERVNERTYNNVLLSTRVGGIVNGGSPEKVCLAPNMVDKIKFPTKLISRRVEAKISGSPSNLNFGQDGDPNVVVDDEVSNASGPINRYLINNLYFTRPYIPTTMRQNYINTSRSNEDKLLAEPLNLAQDHNSFLAQIQKFSEIERRDDGGLVLNESSNYGYSKNLTRTGILNKFKQIGNRKPAMPEFSLWADTHGRLPLDVEEIDCFNSEIYSYCYKYIPNDTTRANRIPFSVLHTGVVGHSFGFGFYNTIQHSDIPLFRGARPWIQYPKGYADHWTHSELGVDIDEYKMWREPNSANIEANLPGDDNKYDNWNNNLFAIQSQSFYAGNFFPFWRTSKWIFDGTKGGGSIFASGYYKGDIQPVSEQDIPRTKVTHDAFPDDLTKRYIGGTSANGGSAYNPGGLFLPPIGVRGRVKFDRFLSVHNVNCRTERYIINGGSWGCADSYEAHDIQAAYHLFHGSDSNLDFYATPSDINSDSDAREDELSWIGTSGFIFDTCSDTLDTNTLIDATDGQAQTINPSSFSSFHKGMFPIGLALSDEGGLYFGPLVGKNLQPFLTKKDTDHNTNYLKVTDPAGRSSNSIPVYSSSSLAGQITNLPYGNVTNNELTREVAPGIFASERMVTVDRLISDGVKEVTTLSNTPKYTYEPEIVLVPEVLAAFFLHSDFSDDNESFGDKNNLNPYAGIQPKPSYFVHFFEQFLTPRQLSNIETNGFRKNAFASKDQNRTVKAMLFAFNYYKNAFSPKVPMPTMRVAWEFDESSLHMSVISLNVARGSNGFVQGINTGVAVSYGAFGNGVFGQMNDELSYTKEGTPLTAIRNVGLGDKNILSTRLDLKVLGGGSSGGTNVGHYMIPGEEEVNLTPWYFAENVCGLERANFVEGSYHFSRVIPGVNGLVADDPIRPFDKFCVAAAIRARPSADRGCVSGGGETLECDIVSPGGMGEANGEVTENLYWDFIRRDTVKPLVGIFTDPESPPSCSLTGDLNARLKSQTFEVNETSEKTTYRASDGWIGALNNDTSNPGCPCSPGFDGECTEDNNMLEIAAVYASIFSEPSFCYDQFSGASIPDLRADKTSLVCPSNIPYCSIPGYYSAASCIAAEGQWEYPQGGTTFSPVVIETPPDAYVEVGTIESSPGTPPGGAAAAYNIFVGKRESAPLTIDQIAPSARVKRTESGVYDAETDTWWQPASEARGTLICDDVPYDEEGVWMKDDPVGYPVLKANWSFLEEKKRYGELDSYYVKTASKQITIPELDPSGLIPTIAAAADMCDWGSTNPEFEIPRLKHGAFEQEGISRPSYQDFTYAIDYDFIAGASSSLTVRQFTPWSSEKVGGDEVTAPSCEIFNDETSIAKENVYMITSDTLDENGMFTIGDGGAATTYEANPRGAPDSSLNSVETRFITGGRWIKVGSETIELTKDDTIPVNCEFYIDSSDGQDGCDSNIPITYETVEGFQITTRAEDGEHGGNAGSAIVMTTFKPNNLEIHNDGGKAGLAGSTSITGGSLEKDMICYQKSENPLAPWIKLYKFNKSVVTVAPASDGNDGSGGTNRTFFGWGIMPKAAEWIKDAVINSTE